MSTGGYRFADFLLDPVERRLRQAGVPVELNARYLDALALLVREQGRLVSKERFLEEVWRGIPVTDEALTQCIKTLRRQLGDSAGSPRFIETVPKHGYRFIAAVEAVAGDVPAAAPGPTPVPAAPAPAKPSPSAWQSFLLLGAAGTIGAGVAGLVGGVFYAIAGAATPPQPGLGAVSVLLVLVCLTMLVAVVGGAGVAFGIAGAGLVAGRPSPWSIAGGALGGLLIGASVKLLGLDAFNLLLGHSPGDITGAAEGLLLGGAVGFGIWFGSRGGGLRPRRSVLAAALAGGGAGIAIALLGGRLMAGSLDLLARSFPDSRLRLDPLGGLFGETGFGPITQTVVGAAEGMLFGACVVGAMALAQRGHAAASAPEAQTEKAAA